MTVRPARVHDLPGFLGLAAQVEQWFGPMVEEPGFHDAVREHIAADMALVTPSSGPDLLGGLLFGAEAPTYHVHWLVVSRRARGTGVGRALMEEAVRRWVRGPGEIEVVTFGPDHPGPSSAAPASSTSASASPPPSPPPGPGGRLPAGLPAGGGLSDAQAGAYLSRSSILRTLPETVIGKVSRSSRRLGTL